MESKSHAEDHVSLTWQAKWIWGNGLESPRNEWRCFRKSFVTPESNLESAKLLLTTDSRYVVYVNGQQVGRGPVRSWPFELAYDEYEIAHLLIPEARNVIAVFVMHYGVSTFQYLRGRGGLLAQIKLNNQDNLILTDESWVTAIHKGYDNSSSRISCQLPFTEINDARAWDSLWTQTAFEDTHWEQATVIGPAGMEPWLNLIERDIPYLTEETLYPVRVESLSAVKPVPWAAVIDLRNHFVPESANHANNLLYSGFIATLIHVNCAANLIIGIVDDGRIPNTISVNGTWFDKSAFTGEIPERFLTCPLQEGDNFVLMNVSGVSHGHGFHIGFDCTEPFEVHNPLTRLQARTQSTGIPTVPSPFISIGPFDSVELIDHQDSRALRTDHPDFEQVKQLSQADDLLQVVHLIRSIEQPHINLQDVFGACVWKKEVHSKPIPLSIQNSVIAGPNAATIPIFDNMDSELVIDFGRELSGYISFEIDAPSGTILDCYGFEYMRDGWKQHTYQIDNTMRYISKEGRQKYTSYVRRGLRYLMVTIREASRPVMMYEVTMLQSNYPVAKVGKFHCSDPLLNDIWEISRHTTVLCMEDTFVDCPAFEQAYWVGDARNEALVNYYLFGSKEIVARCLKLVPGSSFQTPLYVDQVPSGWNSVIPNWTFFWVTACYEYYMYSGDAAFASSIWPHVRSTLDQYLLKLDSRGLLYNKGWNLLDWAPFEQPEEGIVTPQNMVMVQALRNAARLATAIGFVAEARAYQQYSDQLRDAIDHHLWDDTRQAYVDCIYPDGQLSTTTSMQTQVIAILSGIPQGIRAQLLTGYTLNPPESFVQIGSPFMSFFYYESLVKLGRFDVLIDDMRKQYGVMIENDATTCWEMYPNSGFNENPKMLTRSHCHAWSAGPAYFLGAYVLGVSGQTSGWSKVTIAPKPAGLTWARGSVPLPGDGRIDVSWRVDEAAKLMTLRVECPRGIEIEATAPDGYELAYSLIEIG